MAVYTEIPDDDLRAFVAGYAIGDVTSSCKGIAEGVPISNFLLQTTQGPFILTLYERRVNPADLPFFLGLMEHLSWSGVKCPVPHQGSRQSCLALSLWPAGRAGISFWRACGRRRIVPKPLRRIGTGRWPACIISPAMSYDVEARQRPLPARLAGALRQDRHRRRARQAVAPGLHAD